MACDLNHVNPTEISENSRKWQVESRHYWVPQRVWLIAHCGLMSMAFC
jgi:hypothetical protein